MRRGRPNAFLYVSLATLALSLLVPECRAQSPAERIGIPYDWSHHYVIFSKSPSAETTAAVKKDLRYWQQQVRMQPMRWSSRPGSPKKQRLDWSVGLGGTGSTVAPGIYPAKYGFNINALPDCANDYVVFALNVAGSPSQATIVAYNNLYTEPGGTGFCPGTGPTVKWAYNTGGAINTSPVLSLDGTKVAWVASANPPVLHVLTIGTTGSNGTSVSAPAVAGTSNNAVDTAITFGSVGDTHSSPFVNYSGDIAYVGSDDGKIHKFSGIFLGTPTEITTGGWPFHVIDAGNHAIMGPVYDSVSKNLFFNNDIGEFEYVREVGSTVGVCIGNPVPPCWGQDNYSLTSSANFLSAPPTVDSALQKVYVFLGNDNQGFGHARILQTDTQLSSFAPEPTFGVGGQNMFAGAFDHNYFSNPASGFLYVCGYATGGTASPVLYRVGFNSAGKMNSLRDSTHSLALASATTKTRCSPMTEIFNTTTSKDWLFAGLEAGCTATGGTACMMSFDITSGFPAAVSQARTETGGTSGIVIDNVSPKPQASSIYFSTLGTTTCGDGSSGGGCAVKLTQSGLN